MPSGAAVVGRQIVDLHLPQTALVVLISREDAFIVPRGGTLLETGDRLLVLADKEGLVQVRSIVTARRATAPNPMSKQFPTKGDF